MPRNKPDDPFTDDDFGLPGGESTTSDEMPDADSDERPDFLKPYHLKVKQGTCVLIGTTGATDYSDVVLLLEVAGRRFRLGLKTFDPGYKALLAKFGKKRSDWKGTLRYKVMPHKGRPDGYVAIRPA